MQNDFETRIKRIEEKHAPQKAEQALLDSIGKKKGNGSDVRSTFEGSANKRLLAALGVAVLVPSVIAFSFSGNSGEENGRTSQHATARSSMSEADATAAYLRAMTKSPQASIMGHILARQTPGMNEADAALMRSGGPAAIALRNMEAFNSMNVGIQGE